MESRYEFSIAFALAANQTRPQYPESFFHLFPDFRCTCFCFHINTGYIFLLNTCMPRHHLYIYTSLYIIFVVKLNRFIPVIKLKSTLRKLLKFPNLSHPAYVPRVTSHRIIYFYEFISVTLPTRCKSLLQPDSFADARCA